MSSRRVADLHGHDAYALLGIEASASKAQIRRGYRQAMAQAHPDAGGPEDQAKLITCALELLTEDRVNYDEYRRRVAARSGSLPEPGTEDTLDEDWPEEDVDPWADADAGVGDPGQGADAPGAADHPGDGFDDVQDDDRPYRPFTPDRKEHVDPWAWGQLLNLPMVVGALFAVVLVVAVIAGLGNGTTSASSIAGSRIVPPTFRTAYPYPYPISTGYPGTSGGSSAGSVVPDAVASIPGLVGLYPTISPLTLFGEPAHTCARTDAGKLLCRGENGDGQLGVGDRKAHTGPVAVAGGKTWRSVARGAEHTCAIRSDRTLWCWGADDRGQLGTGSGTADATRPRLVNPGWHWRSVAAQGFATCAVRSTGSLWCWGSSILVEGDRPSGSVPHRYRLGNTWTSVHSSRYLLCARRPGHKETCLD